MKRQIILVISAIILLAGCNSKKQQNPEFTVLIGATVFDGTGKIVEKGIIVIKDGLIHSIGGADLDIPDNAEIIDISDKFITPGIIDAHVHLFQTGFADSRPDFLDLRDSVSYLEVQQYQKNNPSRYYKTYLGSGVTGIYDAGGFQWSIALQNSVEKNLNAPHIAAAGMILTGLPRQWADILNVPSDSVIIPLESEEIGRKIVQVNSALGSTGVKIGILNIEDSSFIRNMRAVKDEIDKNNNKMIVHATTLKQAKLALKLGAKVLVHSVDDEVVDDEFIILAKANKVIYCPTLIVGWGYYNTAMAILGEEFEIKNPNSLVDPRTLLTLKNAEKFRWLINISELKVRMEHRRELLIRQDSIMYANLVKVNKSGILIAVGTDAGNPGTLHGISIYDEMEAMQKAGISAMDIIVMATKNGALAMERFDDFGTLEKGKMADLIIMDEDPSIDISNMRSISHVMRGGLLRLVSEPFANTANKK